MLNCSMELRGPQEQTPACVKRLYAVDSQAKRIVSGL